MVGYLGIERVEADGAVEALAELGDFKSLLTLFDIASNDELMTDTGLERASQDLSEDLVKPGAIIFPSSELWV